MIERGWRAAVIGLVSFVFAGCDLGGTYNKRYSESLSSVGERAALDAMLCDDPTEIVDAARKSVGLKLRLPGIFAEHSEPLGAADPNAQPAFLKFPGYSYTLQRLIDDPANPQQFAAVQCYLAAVPKADQKAEDLQADVQRQVAAALPGAPWQDAQLGGGISGKLLSASGPQEFLTADSSGARATATIEGRLDIYYCQSDSHHVLIGFRAPTAHAGKYQFFDAVKLSVDTLTK